jgi:hypothetical protein
MIIKIAWSYFTPRGRMFVIHHGLKKLYFNMILDGASAIY